MPTLLAIDPGANTGIALFFLGPDCPPVLVSAAVVSPDAWVGDSTLPDIVVIENPQIYPHSKARPADVLTLARIVGRYEERFKDAKQRLVLPHEWKGSVPGDIMTERIKAALSPMEKERISFLCKSVAHNAIDAIGLGKWALRQPWMRGSHS